MATTSKTGKNTEPSKTEELKKEMKRVTELTGAVLEEAVEDMKENVGKKASAARETAEKKMATVKKAAERTTADVMEAAEKTAAAAQKSAREKMEEAKTCAQKSIARRPVKSLILQYEGKEIDQEELLERAMAQFGSLEPQVAIKKIVLYVKPEEEAAYYVINDQYSGKVDF